MKIKSIYITKNLAEISGFNAFCQQNQFLLHATSYLDFEAVPAIFRYPTQVYFFSSKNGVDFFLQQQVIESNKKIACVGEATKKHLENLGYTVDFCGEEAGNPIEVGIQLNSWLEGRRVAFICSDISKKTVAIQIPNEQKEEVVFYQTKINGKKITNQFDCYIFTSPSNVNGFFLENTLPKNTIVIAWGNITENELKKHKINCSLVLKNASFEELELEIVKLLDL